MLSSCGRTGDRSSLVMIDSLIAVNPDSACSLLESYPIDSLTREQDQAYYALLFTIARYKAYVPATSDSMINIAVNYYDHKRTDTDHRMRSLLYKGCVMEELKDPVSAIEYYKRAEYACSADDHFNMGYILLKIACVYHRNLQNKIAISRYKGAIRHFDKSKDNKYKYNCYSFFAELYTTIDLDSAYYYGYKGLEGFNATGDSSFLIKANTDLAGICFVGEKYEKSKEYAIEALTLSRGNLTRRDAYFIACESFLKLGRADSAKLILDKFPAPKTTVDSSQYYQCVSNIAQVEGDYKKYVENISIPDKISNELELEMQDNSLQERERMVEMVHEHEQNVKYAKMIVGIVSVLLLIVGVFFIKQRRDRRAFEKARAEVTILNEQISLHINEYKKQLHYYQAQVEQLNDKNEECVIELEKKASQFTQQHKALLESLDSTLQCYSRIMAKFLKDYKYSLNKKNCKIAQFMDEDFFSKLHDCVNLRFDNLEKKMRASECRLSEEEINIVCLDLCHFPTSVIWTYTNCDRIRSVHTKKQRIANKVCGCSSIREIPLYFSGYEK